MPKLRARVTPEDYEKLDATIKGLYEEDADSGDYVLDADFAGHPSEMRLKGTLGKVRKDFATANKRAAVLDGLSDEQIAKLNARIERMRAGADDDDEDGSAGDDGDDAAKDGAKGGRKRRPDVNVVELRKKWEAEFTEKMVKPLSERAEKAEAELKRTRKETKVRDAAIKGGVDPAYLPEVLALTDARFDFDERGALVVKDDDGEVTGLTPEKWFAETYKEQRPIFFLGAKGSGSDSPGGTGGGTRGAPKAGRAVQLAYEDARDNRKYREAKAAADKAGVPLEIVGAPQPA